MSLEQTLELATERHRAGDLAEARRLYQQALAQSPTHAVALVRSGLLELQDGHAEIALARIEQAITSSPATARYQFILGEVLATLARWEEAATAYRRSLEIEPASADVCFALGRALQSVHNFACAIDAYHAAALLQADYADAFNNVGNCHQLLGDLPQAEAAYRRAMELRPDYAGAMANLGAVLNERGQLEEAIEWLRKAAQLEPDAPGHAVNLGAALCQHREFSEAVSVLKPVVERDKSNAEAAYNFANALAGLGQLREAAERYRQAIKLRPDYYDSLNNLGNVYKELGEFKLAGAAYDAALHAQPDSAVASNNLACLMRSLGRFEEAEAILRRALNLHPDHPALHNNLGNVLKDVGELDEAIECFRQAVVLDPSDAGAHGNLAYSLSFSLADGRPILEECLRWNARHAAPLRSEIRVHSNDRSPDRRLRIGYVSPDFRDHCQSLFTIPLLSHHDHSAFEVFCYSSVERPDAYTGRIAGFADTWRDVRPLDDAALTELIRADRIDILVDLTMHMANARPLLFARKPAPVQIAWLAYPGTTGIRSMDYRLSDPRLDPLGFEKCYSEKTIRLPDSFWCYDPLTDEPEVNGLPALTNGYLTLGCLNNPCKLTDHTLRLWAGVMRGLLDSRLLLMSPPGMHQDRLRKRLISHGIAADRVDFVAYRPRADYLRTYHQIDLGLDTFPYNGHTTSFDSLWMGVPVITRIGQTCVGRGGLSQLFQLGLLELASESDDGFASVAVEIAHDLPRLARLRQELRARLARSPLMDAKRFARNMEDVYRQTWRDVDIRG
jgi:protein O-GlcNAc transferase